jgi:hypothetical protein
MINIVNEGVTYSEAEFLEKIKIDINFKNKLNNLKMEKYFKEQLDLNPLLTQEMIDKGQIKMYEYFNNDKIQANDMLLFAWVRINETEDYDFMQLTKRHFNQIEFDSYLLEDTVFPVIKIIKNKS